MISLTNGTAQSIHNVVHMNAHHEGKVIDKPCCTRSSEINHAIEQSVATLTYMLTRAGESNRETHGTFYAYYYLFLSPGEVQA